MTMKNLPHKDKKEKVNAHMAYLVFTETQPNAEKTKKTIFFQRSTEAQ